MSLVIGSGFGDAVVNSRGVGAQWRATALQRGVIALQCRVIA
jgi:hypothetical protein